MEQESQTEISPVMQELLPITTQPRRPALRYHGGKWALAPWIIEHFPEHRVYVEPFGGGASVLLRKQPSAIEIYNDLDEDVVNYFSVLRDPDNAARLQRLLELTPFSRAEFEASYEPAADPLERARRLVFRSFGGFASHSHNINNTTNGFRWSSTQKSEPAIFCGIAAELPNIAARMRSVLIERRHAFEVIAQHDREDTLFFLDPPYPRATRDDHTKGYAHELTDYEHRQLAHIVTRCKGKVILCGYPCHLYDNELYSSWRRVERKAKANGQRGSSERTEVLWLNF